MISIDKSDQKKVPKNYSSMTRYYQNKFGIYGRQASTIEQINNMVKTRKSRGKLDRLKDENLQQKSIETRKKLDLSLDLSESVVNLEQSPRK